LIANPVRLLATSVDYRLSPPLLGQHTDEVLTDRLGFDRVPLATLRAAKVIFAVCLLFNPRVSSGVTIG
jgi:crotonobetainyl-CoA:carnitine CoA-transferase CaiB-like acyl-CoA transferase